MHSSQCPVVQAHEKTYQKHEPGPIGYHSKPCCFYNINGFFSPLLAMFHKMVTHQFMKADYADMLITENQPEALIAAIRIINHHHKSGCNIKKLNSINSNDKKVSFHTRRESLDRFLSPLLG